MAHRTRSQARVLALQALCIFDAVGEDFTPDLDEFLRDSLNHADLGWRRAVSPQTLGFARELAMGAWRNRARSDELLRRYVPGWTVERMQPIDRNILRLGLFELLEQPETPHQVILNEAVELARRFGGDESGGFVNGVLDGVWRAVVGRRSSVVTQGVEGDGEKPSGMNGERPLEG
jgi:N utilization substance protein B